MRTPDAKPASAKLGLGPDADLIMAGAKKERGGNGHQPFADERADRVPASGKAARTSPGFGHPPDVRVQRLDRRTVTGIQKPNN